MQGRWLRVSAARDPEAGATRFGLVTPRRLGKAVDRNRVRRRLREICRLYRELLAPGFLVVVIAKPSALGASFWKCERNG